MATASAMRAAEGTAGAPSGRRRAPTGTAIADCEGIARTRRHDRPQPCARREKDGAPKNDAEKNDAEEDDAEEGGE